SGDPELSCSCTLRTQSRFPSRMSRRGMVRKSRAWVLEKKERHRRQGREVRPDTQYTGRKRKPRF
ncbi:BUD23 isoform 7, partial [Pongo abelii]